MAENNGSNNQLDDDLLLEEDERDFLFRAQMGAANFILGYWKHAVGLLGGGLVITLGYGLWDGQRTDARRATHAQVARILTEMQAGLSNPDTLDAAATAGAEQLETAAVEGSASAATWAWIWAGQVWDSIEESEKGAAAWAKADALNSPGMMGWAAASGHGHALVEAGDLDGAAQVYLRIADQKMGMISEEALFTIGQAYLDAERFSDSAAIFERFTTEYPNSSMLPRVAAALQVARGSN